MATAFNVYLDEHPRLGEPDAVLNDADELAGFLERWAELEAAEPSGFIPVIVLQDNTAKFTTTPRVQAGLPFQLPDVE